MVKFVRAEYSSLFFDIPNEYYIAYNIYGVNGVIRIWEMKGAAPERRYRTISTDGTITEAGTLKTFFQNKGCIAEQEARFISKLLNK